jgi:hypothetical protein
MLSVHHSSAAQEGGCDYFEVCGLCSQQLTTAIHPQTGFPSWIGRCCMSSAEKSVELLLGFYLNAKPKSRLSQHQDLPIGDS